MDEFSETGLVHSESDTVAGLVERLNYCEPSLPVQLQDTKTNRRLTVRTFCFPDPTEQLVKYLIGISSGQEPIGICQIGIPLERSSTSGKNRAAFCGGRNTTADLIETIKLEDYEVRDLQRYYSMFDTLNGVTNNAFEISANYQGQEYGKLMLLMTQLLVSQRGVNYIRFMQDKTISDGRSFYSNEAIGEPANGNTNISANPSDLQLTLLDRFQIQ